MQRFLWRIYAYRFFDAFKLIGPLFTILFQRNGLDTFQIALLISIWSVAQLSLEVPLGAVADTYSRKKLLILGVLVLAVGYGFWFIGTFWAYAIGFVLWGVKNALISGTLEAFVYDELKSIGKEEMYERVNGKLDGTFWAGVAASAVVGGFVATINFNVVLLLSIFSLVFAAIILLPIQSVHAVKSTGEKTYFIVIKKALQEIKYNTRLFEILLFFCLIFATWIN